MNKKQHLRVVGGLLASGALFACSLAQAAPITGDWLGGFTDTTNSTGPLTHGSVNLNILTETPDGANFDLTAVLNTICIPAASNCGSQNVSLSGTLGATLGISFSNASVVAFGTVASDYSKMGGMYESFDPTGALVITGNWSAVPAGSVPEPTTLSLFGFGVAGVAFMKRRRTR